MNYSSEGNFKPSSKRAKLDFPGKTCEDDETVAQIETTITYFLILGFLVKNYCNAVVAVGSRDESTSAKRAYGSFWATSLYSEDVSKIVRGTHLNHCNIFNCLLFFFSLNV